MINWKNNQMRHLQNLKLHQVSKEGQRRQSSHFLMVIVSYSLSGPRGHGRCQCGFSPKVKMAVLSVAVLWSAPAGLWRLRSVSAGKSDSKLSSTSVLTLEVWTVWSVSHLSLPLFFLLQVWQRPVQVRGAGRSLRTDSHPGTGSGSQEVQGSERRSWPGFAEASQLQGPLSDLWPQHQRSMPSYYWCSIREKYSIFLCCHGYHWLDRSRYVFFSLVYACCISFFNV